MSRALALFLAIVLFASVLPSAAATNNRPFRGSLEFSVLLCSFRGSPTPSRDLAFYQNMFLGRDVGGLNDYWSTTSYGGMNLDGVVVKGWYGLPSTAAEATAELSRPDRDRGKYFNECIEAARTSRSDPYTVPSGQFTVVVTDPGVDLWGATGSGAFVPSNVDLGSLAHEVGHALGLQHSFSDDPGYRNAEWAQIGEYDDQWDLMSFANVASMATASHGNGGPGLNAYHLDQMGWLPRHRIRTLGADGVGAGTVTLAALSHPEAEGDLLLRLPFDPGDPFHYYTVEFRQADGWDAGIGSDIVLIHEVKYVPGTGYTTFLIREHSGSRAPVQTLTRNGVTVSVGSMSSASHQATVTVSTAIVDRCLQGFVWREAVPSDHTCVVPSRRDGVRAENDVAAARRDPNGGPYGPDTCLAPFVWREATPDDHVCVEGGSRELVALENTGAAELINPARFVYGPNTCTLGFVWREADASDWVCVSGEAREQARADNEAAPSRVDPNGAYGPNTCISGFVWREAFPGDFVCVTTEVRAQAAADNDQASTRLAAPQS